MKLEKKLELQEKGWNDQEIIKAEAALDKEEHHDVFFSKIVFWSALVLIVFANLAVSLILIPFIIVLNAWVLYAIIVVLAGMLGFIYNFLITDIGHLGKKHHILAGIFVPLLALSNMIIMVLYSNRFIADLEVNNVVHNPWLLSIIFVIAFILPYILDRVINKFKKKKAIIVKNN